MAGPQVTLFSEGRLIQDSVPFLEEIGPLVLQRLLSAYGPIPNACSPTGNRLPQAPESTKLDRTCARNSDFWATVIRDLGPALQLFWIESERLKLSTPFSRRVAEPLNADAAGQATFYGCLNKIGSTYGSIAGALPRRRAT